MVVEGLLLPATLCPVYSCWVAPNYPERCAAHTPRQAHSWAQPVGACVVPLFCFCGPPAVRSQCQPRLPCLPTRGWRGAVTLSSSWRPPFIPMPPRKVSPGVGLRSDIPLVLIGATRCREGPSRWGCAGGTALRQRENDEESHGISGTQPEEVARSSKGPHDKAGLGLRGRSGIEYRSLCSTLCGGPKGEQSAGQHTGEWVGGWV